jgi:hypothetical protein
VDNPIFFILILVSGPMLVWMALWTVYVIGFRDLAKFWFGEHDGYRRDREALRRRQRFENCCLWAAKFFYGTWIVGLVHGMLGERLPDISWMFWSAQATTFIVGILCAWAAADTRPLLNTHVSRRRRRCEVSTQLGLA